MSSEFIALVLEQMAFIKGLRLRAMFGGHGVYCDDCMFAIIADDRLYLKTDSNTRSEFIAQQSRPFTYSARGKSVTIQYFEAPPEVFEAPEAMHYWAQKACATAIRTKKTKRSP